MHKYHFFTDVQGTLGYKTHHKLSSLYVSCLDHEITSIILGYQRHPKLHAIFIQFSLIFQCNFSKFAEYRHACLYTRAGNLHRSAL